MKIAILGTGNVGSALGKRWAANGHEIIFGSREPESDKVRGLVQAAGGKTSAATYAGAVNQADVILLATPFHSAQETLASLGSLGGKLLIDATNPFGPSMRLIPWPDSSAAEQIASWAADAKVVKAFNMTGSGNMANTDYGAMKPAMFICGEDGAAKNVVLGLSNEIGFDTIDCGPLTAARYLEAIVGLWVNLAYTQGMGPNMAFALLRR